MAFEEGQIAYFSMEIGLHNSMPTYSGGLGVLAGDTIRSAADLGVPLVAVTLLHRKGYFFQRIKDGVQSEEPVEWEVRDFLQEMPERAAVEIAGRKAVVRAWRYEVKGVTGRVVPVYLLDTDLEGNAAEDRALTHCLYGGDRRYRLAQEIVLGMGGVRMLRALGYKDIRRFHMNEGHASLLALQLLEEHAQAAGRKGVSHDDIDAVRRLCVFTTHTPVSAGFDNFSKDLVHELMDREHVFAQSGIFLHEGALNMTYLGLNLSHYVNGVARRHGETARLMFGKYAVDSITNGVHVDFWAAPAMKALFDRHLPDWRVDNFNLRHALSIPKAEVWAAHAEAKAALIERVNGRTNAGFKEDVFTIGFARRAAEYKRADLFFRDPERLSTISASAGPVQAVFAGKAHPQDRGGKEMIRRVSQAMEGLKGKVKMVYLPGYDMDLGRRMTSGCDLWLNTPQPPLEASGTSGMKAAVNGVPSLSVRDGWWVEGHLEGVTGWAIAGEDGREAESIYKKLGEKILPMFYKDRDAYVEVMRHAIAINGSYFNTQRMMQQYLVKAYLGG